MNTFARPPGQVRKLPPLILHPFSEAPSTGKLSLSARASLILSGFVPSEELGDAQLRRRVLDTCYSEIKMLFYIGKDLERWLEQCVEVIQRDSELCCHSIGPESFAALLIEDPPAPLRKKLESWGVTDYRAIFRRALGLHCLFDTVPEKESLTADFLRFHDRYADCLYRCRIEGSSCTKLDPAVFEFDVFSSSEYARLLEEGWERTDV